MAMAREGSDAMGPVRRNLTVPPSLSRNVPTNYKSDSNNKGLPLRFLFECSQKLAVKPLTSATAAIVYHRFFRETGTSEFDPFMIACSCLYLAGKIKDDKLKKRDIINVAHNTLNRGAPPLELGDEYWSMWDTIVQAELFIIRVLKFDMTVVHPHKHMIHYMKSLQDLFGINEWRKMPVAKTAASFLQDFHHNPKVLNYEPSHIAICCLALAFQVYGIQVPLNDPSDDSSPWYKVYCDDLTRETHWEIIDGVMEVYDTEAEIDNK